MLFLFPLCDLLTRNLIDRLVGLLDARAVGAYGTTQDDQFGVAFSPPGDIYEAAGGIKGESVAANFGPELVFAGVLAILRSNHIHISIVRDREQAMCALIEPQIICAIRARYPRHFPSIFRIKNQHGRTNRYVELLRLRIEGQSG